MINIHINSKAPGAAELVALAETDKELAAVRRYTHRGTSQIMQGDIEDATQRANEVVRDLRKGGFQVRGTSIGFTQWSA